MDIAVECKDKASVLIQRKTHTRLRCSHMKWVIICLTRITALTGLSSTKSNTGSLKHYTRGRDLAVERMSSPTEDVQEGSDLLVRELFKSRLLTHCLTVFNQSRTTKLWISFESQRLHLHSYSFSSPSKNSFKQPKLYKDNQLDLKYFLFIGIYV